MHIHSCKKKGVILTLALKGASTYIRMYVYMSLLTESLSSRSAFILRKMHFYTHVHFKYNDKKVGTYRGR